MPSNQQRREAAKRKLQRQLVRREQARARRRRTTLIAGTAAVILVAAGVIALVATHHSPPAAADANSTATDASGSAGTAATAASSTAPALPCTYTAAGKAAKAVKLPTNTSPANKGDVKMTITLNGQPVDVTLDRALAPCSVNSVLSLASQGFYNDTSCHRLTKSPALNVLQCGDPSGKGNGDPGYTYPAKVATDAKYPVGTLAMANTQAGEGSQFFIVYGTSTPPPQYSVIGTVSAAGMKVVQDIAAKGVKNDSQDGAPNDAAKISTVTVPSDAVTATTSYPPSSSAAAGAGVPNATGAPVPTQAPVSNTTTK
ncbi:MAG: peptidylprolyl isomerase [Actinomycetota bacterium]|nr:peptidylprolyl isomerase [Actinomycetota bacterium]